MEILFVYQNYTRSFTGLGETYLRELKKTNHSIKEFEFKSLSKNKYLNKIYSVLKISTPYFKRQNNALYNVVEKDQPKTILILKGSDLDVEILKNIKKKFPKIKIATFNPDDPFNPRSCRENIRRAIPYNDFYFIWTKQLINKLEESGAKKAVYIPFATDVDIIKPASFQNFLYDITFIGNADKERIEWMQRIAKAVSNIKPTPRIDIFGEHWPQIPNTTLHSQANGKAYLETIRASKASINILRKQNKNATNMRTFEIPAAGGIMFHETSEEAQDFFTREDPVFFFKDETDFVNKYNDLINDLNYYQKQTENLVEKLHSDDYDYTYKNRINKILSQLSS